MIPDFNILLLLRILVVLGMAAFFYRIVIKNLKDAFAVGNYDRMLILQSLLILILLAATPFTPFYLPLWVQFLGLASMILGSVMVINGYFDLGTNFSGGVAPIDKGHLVTSGYYAL